MVSEHVLGSSDEVDIFVQGLVEKRKATDYLRVAVENLRRFDVAAISSYKQQFTKVGMYTHHFSKWLRDVIVP